MHSVQRACIILTILSHDCSKKRNFADKCGTREWLRLRQHLAEINQSNKYAVTTCCWLEQLTGKYPNCIWKEKDIIDQRIYNVSLHEHQRAEGRRDCKWNLRFSQNTDAHSTKNIYERRVWHFLIWSYQFYGDHFLLLLILGQLLVPSLPVNHCSSFTSGVFWAKKYPTLNLHANCHKIAHFEFVIIWHQCLSVLYSAHKCYVQQVSVRFICNFKFGAKSWPKMNKKKKPTHQHSHGKGPQCYTLVIVRTLRWADRYLISMEEFNRLKPKIQLHRSKQIRSWKHSATPMKKILCKAMKVYVYYK